MRQGLTMLLLLVITLATISSHDAVSAGNKIFVCYFTPTSYFPASAVPPSTCTHLIYAFGKISRNSIFLGSGGERTVKTLVQLKRQNPSLKILISLQQGFPSVVTPSLSTMTEFAENAVKVLRENGVDGVDFDWEVPRSKDKNNYSKFLKVFRNIVTQEASRTGEKTLLVSMALANNVYSLRNGYDVPSINQNVDFYTVMAYDFHVFNSKYDNLTGFNSPLFPVSGESKFYSTSGLITYCLGMGFTSSKLLLGIPTYGRSFKLANSGKHGVHAPAVGKGDPGPYRHFHGIYLYPDVCVAIQQGATVVSDSTSHGKYLYKAASWVSFDDVITVAEKTRWALDQRLGGVGIWAVHLDDVDGVCSKTKLPLMTAIKNALNI